MKQWSAVRKENYRPLCLMNIDANFSTKYLQTESNIVKDSQPWSSGIYCWDARMVQNMQVNKCDILH